MKLKNIVLMAMLLLVVSSVAVMAENELIEGKDLALMSYNVMPKPAVLSESVQVSLEIKNIGAENIDEKFTIEFQACKPDGSGCHIPSGADVNGLKAGKTESITRGFYLSENDIVNGKTLIKFVVDGDNQVEETNEGNNVYNMIVNVIEVIEEEPVEEVILESVKFPVSVNDYPDHKDYDLSEDIPFAYVNMYVVELVGDAFKVVETETKNTGKKAEAIFEIQPGEMVYFEGFKTMGGAEKGVEEKKALLWSAPPFKNFGTGGNKLYQTHWTKINEFLKYDQDYAAADSLSVPYQEIGKGMVELIKPVEKLKLVVKGDVKGVNLDWNGLSSFGKTFDKYNVQRQKGKILTNPANAYVGWDYYNFGNLQSGDYWTFKVCPSKNKQVVGVCSNTVTVLVKEDLGFVKPVKIPMPIKSLDKVKPEMEEMIPEYFLVECPNGCAYESKCLPVGTKIKENGDALYCGWEGEMKEQLLDGAVCQNNYECLSNSCMSGKCLDLEEKLKQQQNLLERILDWLKKMFD